MTDAESLTMDLPESVDEPALRRVKTVARVMDEAVEIPGTGIRVGLDPVLGVVPGAGDAVAAGISLYIVAEAAYLGVPLSTIVRMLANVAADAVLGSIPVVGPVFDTFIRANKWNASYIEEFVADAAGDDEGEAVDAAADEDDGPVVIEITEE
ncbi:DUF4112 domain-containing protein [Halobaculum magnesiiphilum]|uniref:DUF4112 domain-containing protein n=1 Tax=Halobaculum magnesiiphilum TaxID=1017351 RepID=A0A8T8WFM4_9EURY|nr:DUF4112 domain-containing protein [Halobaculum magnesiiphilum]QZP38659.1 DUF4112 domain-containing protein [Halobaculum magnesiiphilum]